MKVSVITVCFNSGAHIGKCISSVNSQVYPDIEHIFVDGGSSDDTIEIINQYCPSAVVLSESDDGIYDAMNKGFHLSTGDVICYLNSDDQFADSDVVGDVVTFLRGNDCSGCFSNIDMVDHRFEVVRRWVPGEVEFSPAILQPQLPHPGLFLYREAMSGDGDPFPKEFLICGDLYLQLKLIKSGVSLHWFDRLTVLMALGGASTQSIGAMARGWREAARAWNLIHGHGGALFVAQKVARKIIQYF